MLLRIAIQKTLNMLKKIAIKKKFQKPLKSANNMLQFSNHRKYFLHMQEQFLCNENNTARLLILELLLVHEQTPHLSNQYQFKPLLIFDTYVNCQCVKPTTPQ